MHSMKHNTIIPVALLMLSLALPAVADTPGSVLQLNRQYREKLDQACAPVNAWYLDELQKLHADAQQQNQTADAEHIAQLIHTIAPDATPEPIESDAPELERVKTILPDIAREPALMSYELPAADARLTGDVRFDGKDLSLWRGNESAARWQLPDTFRPGLYQVSLLYSTDIASPAPFELRCQDQILSCRTIERTGAWHKYRKRPIGHIRLPANPGTIELIKKGPAGFLFNLKMLYLDQLPEPTAP